LVSRIDKADDHHTRPDNRRFAHSEFVHCIKIVSDNKNSPHSNITPASARQQISENSDAIGKFSDHLLTLHQSTNDYTPAVVHHKFFSQWQFSKTQTQQLTRLLARYTAFNKPLLEIPESLNNCSNASQVVEALTLEIERKASLL